MKEKTEVRSETGTVLDLNTALPVSPRTGTPRGKPFEPGNRAGKGRRQGSRNEKTRLLQDLLDEYGQPVIRKLLKMALDGNGMALKLVTERLVPPAQENRIQMRLPPVRSSADLTKASAAVIQAATRGEMTTDQAKAMTEMLLGHRRLFESEDLERRIAQIERLTAASSDSQELESAPAQTLETSADPIVEPVQEDPDAR